MACASPASKTIPVASGTSWAASAVVFAGFLALSTLYLRPIWSVFASHVAPGLGDVLFNLYVLDWGVHQIDLGLPDFWNAPFFFPTRGVLAFSDHLLGPAFQMWLFLRLGGNAIAGYNFLFLGSFVLAAFSTYWVFCRSGARPWAAAFGGLVYSFCSFRWDQSGHIQMLLAGWIPFLLWTWDRLLVELSPRRAVAFLAFYLLHVSGGTYLAYMAHVPLLVLLVNRRREVWEQLRSALWPRIVAASTLIASGLVALWFFLPYWRITHLYDLRRGENEYRTWGASLLSLLSPAFWTNYHSSFTAGFVRSENALFLGILPSVLIAWELVARSAPVLHESPLAGSSRRLARALALVTSLVGFALADWRTLTGAARLPIFGLSIPLAHYLVPTLLWAGGLALWLWLGRPWAPRLAAAMPWGSAWERGLLAAGAVTLALCFPIVFVPAARLVPGLGSMRVPARFFALASLALAWLAARGAERFVARLPARFPAHLAATLLLGLTALELAPRKLYWFDLPTGDAIPAADRWLATAPDVRAIADLPFAREATIDTEAYRMYLATTHWKPIVNGFSGYFAPSYLALREAIPLLPDRQSLVRLRTLGVSHIIVRLGELRRPARRARALVQWTASIGRPDGPELQLVFAEPRHRVYQILPAGARPSPAVPATPPGFHLH